MQPPRGENTKTSHEMAFFAQRLIKRYPWWRMMGGAPLDLRATGLKHSWARDRMLGGVLILDGCTLPEAQRARERADRALP